VRVNNAIDCAIISHCLALYQPMMHCETFSHIQQCPWEIGSVGAPKGHGLAWA